MQIGIGVSPNIVGTFTVTINGIPIPDDFYLALTQEASTSPIKKFYFFDGSFNKIYDRNLATVFSGFELLQSPADNIAIR